MLNLYGFKKVSRTPRATDPAVRAAAPQIFEHPFFTRTGLDDLHKVVRRKKKKTVSHADVQETRRQAEIVMMGASDREALQAERHALATRVAELEKQLAAFTPQVTAPSSRAGSMDAGSIKHEKPRLASVLHAAR